MMLRLTSVLVASLVAPVALAAGSTVELESPQIDTSNEKSLQRGARTFVNNCMGCHSLGYQRYSRLAQDLELSEEDVEKNFIFTTDEAGEPTKVGSLMFNNMTKEYGEQAFGVVPPNLSLTARSRGVDWIYTYMKSFYIDPDRGGVGVNNTVYPGAAMPHVLADLQGWQEPIYEEHDGEKTVVGLKLATEGSQTPKQYDATITDLTNFLAYVSDPIKETRHRMGMFVMAFLFGLLAIAYFLKQEYWKDVVKKPV